MLQFKSNVKKEKKRKELYRENMLFKKRIELIRNVKSLQWKLGSFFFYLKRGYFWGIVFDTILIVQEASVHVYNYI